MKTPFVCTNVHGQETIIYCETLRDAQLWAASMPGYTGARPLVQRPRFRMPIPAVGGVQ